LRSENTTLAEELRRQETLYGELKKMRGRGEEIEYLQECQQVKVTVFESLKAFLLQELQHYRSLSTDLESRAQHMEAELENASAEKTKLLREISRMRAGRGVSPAPPALSAHLLLTQASPQTASTTGQGLAVRELAAGLVFVLIALNWFLTWS